MKAALAVRMAAVALAASATASAALAQGDIYSRLMEMPMMGTHVGDGPQQGMVSKQEFMAMVEKVWDNYVTEKRSAAAR